MKIRLNKKKTLFVIVLLFLMVLILFQFLYIRTQRIIGKGRTAVSRARSVARAFDLYFMEHGCYPNIKKKGLNLLSGEPYSNVFRNATGTNKVPIRDGYGHSLYIAQIDNQYFVGSVGENGQLDLGNKDDFIVSMVACSNGSQCFCDWDSNEEILWLADLPP